MTCRNDLVQNFADSELQSPPLPERMQHAHDMWCRAGSERRLHTIYARVCKLVITELYRIISAWSIRSMNTSGIATTSVLPIGGNYISDRSEHNSETSALTSCHRLEDVTRDKISDVGLILISCMSHTCHVPDAKSIIEKILALITASSTRVSTDIVVVSTTAKSTKGKEVTRQSRASTY
jgi:hypothetical protein